MKSLRFGIEIETTCKRETAARAVAAAIGGYARFAGGFYQAWEVVQADGRKWKMVTDSSIGCRWGGCEVVSPILTYDDMETLQKVVRALRGARARVTASSGIHVHIDASTLDVKAICNLAKLWNRQERVINRALVNSHRSNWCREENSDGLVDRIVASKPKTMADLAKAWYNTAAVEGRIACHYDNSRYHALNLHNLWYRRPNGTVEFRCFNSTLHAGKIRAYVCLCLAMVARSKAARSVQVERKPLDENTVKYDMRQFMIKLGLVGDEYKNVRKHLLATLPGSSRSANTGIARGGRARRENVNQAAA